MKILIVNNMTTTFEWTDMMLVIGSVVAAGGFTLLAKSFLGKYRRPNGKKGGVISCHTAVAFAVVTAIALSTKDWFLTGLTIILAYLIGRGRLDEGQHYMYQVVLGAIFGVAIPYGIFYIYYNRITGSSGGDMGRYNSDREKYVDKPARAHDDRMEADDHSDLRIDDIEDFE